MGDMDMELVVQIVVWIAMVMLVNSIINLVRKSIFTVHIHIRVPSEADRDRLVSAINALIEQIKRVSKEEES